MTNYENIAVHCHANSKISEQVIDEWLVPYAAEKDRLDKHFAKRIKRFSGAANQLASKDINMLISQYIGHSVFKEGGLVYKYLTHSQVKARPSEEYAFLEYQAANPWKFAFTVIVDEPASDFYTMEDVFTGENYLVYSPGTGVTIRERGRILLWFNLIGFNGQCWQTFGPVVGYNSFDADDIFFFATEFSDRVSDEESLLENLENNPLPYMMLIAGAAYPATYHNGEEIVYALSVYEDVDLNMESIEKAFEMKYTQGLYQFIQIGWGEFPYSNRAYYNELDKEVLLHSMTDIGYRNLAKAMSNYGIKQDDYPQIRVHLSMLITIRAILGRDIILNEYEEYFEEEAPEPESEGIKKLNELMAMLLPAINAGQTPNVEVAAKKLGVDLETANEAVKMFQEQIGKRRR